MRRAEFLWRGLLLFAELGVLRLVLGWDDSASFVILTLGTLGGLDLLTLALGLLSLTLDH